jgi:hypothetical protein
MTESPAPRSGGQVLIDALHIHGVDTVFCVPGESYLAALDALAGAGNKIRTITCRHEGSAAYMAEAYGKLTGKPGVLMVTRGPGACHASVGVHTGFQDSTPMLVLIGQVARDHEYREAFQEIDYHTFSTGTRQPGHAPGMFRAPGARCPGAAGRHADGHGVRRRYLRIPTRATGCRGGRHPSHAQPARIGKTPAGYRRRRRLVEKRV